MRRATHLIIFLLSMASSVHAANSADDANRFWSSHIQPLFADNCFKCHGNIETKSGLSVMTPAQVLKGGDNGPAVVPGKPEKSLLYKYVQAEADPHMPPKGKQLTPEEMALIKRWIEKLSPADVVAATNSVASNTGTPSSLFRKPTWSPPKELSTSEAIDFLIEKRWRESKVKPSGLCDDRTFVRRVYLDITGRIPTPTELNAFLSEKRRDKRAALVSTLTDGTDYPVRMREVFDVVFMERGAFETPRERRRRGAGNAPQSEDRWRDYLEWSFRENRPWNAVAREILLARPVTNETRGAMQFLYARKDNAQQMAEATGSALLGLQIKCAQCHDHPLAPEIHQSHYWGMVAAFNRSKAVETSAGAGVAESAIGGFIKFTNLKGGSSDALLRLLDERLVEETRPKDGEKENDLAEKYVNAIALGEGKNLKAVPIPKFSRREEFANWVCDTNNPLLARAFVNRVWALLLGRGLVHPVDRMDSSRAASHPELLDWLASDFAKGGYDVKRLIRNITATRAYQIDSRPAGKIRLAPDSFACALDKPLSAEVFARSLLVATGSEPGKEGEFNGVDLARLQKNFAEVYPDVFPIENVSSLRQAMFLSNNRTVDALAKSSSTNALASLAALEDKAKVCELFVRVLGREPDRDEMSRSLEYLRTRSHEPAAATQQLLWALVSSAEFRFNH